MKIKELVPSERPREKMLERGAEALSDCELLAVLLLTGVVGKSALEIARELYIASGGSLSSLFAMSPQELLASPGIGKYKAASLIAAFELGRRFIAEETDVVHKPILTGRMVYDIMIPGMKGLRKEECWVLFLSTSNYLLGKTRVSTGGLESTVIDIKHVVKAALDRNASAIILVHNHPGGNPRPSRADIQQTDKLKQAAAAFDLHLLDHIIICDDCFFSFEDGRMKTVTSQSERQSRS